MTINELKESGKKRRAASMLHLGIADQRELCWELKINRNLLRHRPHWDYRLRVLKWTKQQPMKENRKTQQARLHTN
ncbi:MAG: hypothetical protein IT258_10240 [Saprospiraceae bacterium]|nr:hypothetical protein [Saprospiraceae bacterium]